MFSYYIKHFEESWYLEVNTEKKLYNQNVNDQTFVEVNNCQGREVSRENDVICSHCSPPEIDDYREDFCQGCCAISYENA